jgi:hypothetical protein
MSLEKEFVQKIVIKQFKNMNPQFFETVIFTFNACLKDASLDVSECIKELYLVGVNDFCWLSNPIATIEHQIQHFPTLRLEGDKILNMLSLLK